MRIGRLARLGLRDAAGTERARECAARIREAGARAVRFAFADPHGALRSKTLVGGAWEGALVDGLAVPSSLLLKDTSQRTAFGVWDADARLDARLRGAGDVLLVPRPESWRTLDWADGAGWLGCDVVHADGAPIPFDSRTVLGCALERLHGAGLDLVCGLEIELHVYRLEGSGLAHERGSMPAEPPPTSLIAPGWQLLGESCHDAMHEVFAPLHGVCDALGLPLRTLESEMGPGQVEMTFEPADAMSVADDAVALRAAVRQACRRRGLHASFMCRPRLPGGAASGWHLHQSVVGLEDRRNRFVPADADVAAPAAAGWIAGLLHHARESCLMTTPTVNGYRRYRTSGQLAPDRVCWAADNKGAMLRSLLRPGDAASRIENRVADPSANPHFLLASQVLAGLDGIERGLVPPPPVESPHACDAARLPADLGAAIEDFDGHGLYRRTLGDAFVDHLLALKSAEWRRYLDEVSEWEAREYFSMF